MPTKAYTCRMSAFHPLRTFAGSICAGPALEHRGAVDLEQPLHLSCAGVQVVLQQSNCRIHLRIALAIAREMVGSRQHSRAVGAVLNGEFFEDAGHVRLTSLGA